MLRCMEEGACNYDPEALFSDDLASTPNSTTTATVIASTMRMATVSVMNWRLPVAKMTVHATTTPMRPTPAIVIMLRKDLIVKATASLEKTATAFAAVRIFDECGVCGGSGSLKASATATERAR